MIKLRDYQEKAIKDVFAWFKKAKSEGLQKPAPIMVLPTGAGKSIIIAQMIATFWQHRASIRPRVVVLVPSKELAEQNAEKIRLCLPQGITCGYYSASLNEKDAQADVIVATIGSIYNDATKIGNIKCVIIDECHRVNPDNMGQYRHFLETLEKYCDFITIGCTATPFRGNGVHLTCGKDPLFTAKAHETKIEDLIDAGYLSTLRTPSDVGLDAHLIKIDTSNVSTVNGDYNVAELSDVVQKYLSYVAITTARLFTQAKRKKLLAFTPSVKNAQSLNDLLRFYGFKSCVVTGNTPKAEREQMIRDYKEGKINSLVTVLALTTGFDVPSVDCLVWCRPTKSPVLYVQGAGRGLRIAPDKDYCLWLDFSDTTERLGAINGIEGKNPKPKKAKPVQEEQKAGSGAGTVICQRCGFAENPANRTTCLLCGEPLPPKKQPKEKVSTAPVLIIGNHQHEIHAIGKTFISPYRSQRGHDMIKVDYFAPNAVTSFVREYINFDADVHEYAYGKACQWWHRQGFGQDYPRTNVQALEQIRQIGHLPRTAIKCTLKDSKSDPRYKNLNYIAFSDNPDEFERV